MVAMEQKSMQSVLEYAKMQFEQNLPFVLYNKPNSNRLIGFFQKDSQLHLVKNFKEIGFVFAPFDKQKIVLIPQNQSVCYWAECKVEAILQNQFSPIEIENQESKAAFEKLVKEAIDSIATGLFQKVVLSRKETVALVNFDLLSLFSRLLNENPTAFAYCFYHPDVGLWVGAFSEQLVRIAGSEFQTMAVAGTQMPRENETVVWEKKEQEEQQFVSDFIVENLKSVASKITMSASYTLRAGKVAHLKTDIQGMLKVDSDLKKVLAVLHPTPAVCGFPKASAKQFILKHEGYDRQYYSGFFGEWNTDFETAEEITDLYVNLRCMKIKNNQAFLYVGCGITKDSSPEKEWMETVNKSITMKRILTTTISSKH